MGNHAEKNINNIGWTFEKWWSTLTGYNEVLKNNWESADISDSHLWQQRIQGILRNLYRWSKHHPENLKNKINSLWKDLQDAYNANNLTYIHNLTNQLENALN